MTDSSPDLLKLTAYFAERERTDRQFLADAMLDLFSGKQVDSAIVLRGIASFGPRNIVRSDESLSLSEDPPITVIAVDTPERLAPLVEDVVAMTGRGLLALERARSGASAANPAGDHDVRMSVYVGRRRRINGAPAYVAVCDLLHRLEFSGATAFLGVDGIVSGSRQRARFFSTNGDVPMMVLAIGASEPATAAATQIERLLPGTLVTFERIQVCKRDGTLLTRPQTIPASDAGGLPLYQKVTVHTSEDSRHDGAPIHRALIRQLHASHHASGATVLRGVWGFHGDHRPHGDKMFGLSRHMPVTTIIIDTPESIAHSFGIVDGLTDQHGLVTAEFVPAMLALDGDRGTGSTSLAQHDY